jgi:hypothetical protein
MLPDPRDPLVAGPPACKNAAGIITDDPALAGHAIRGEENP